MELGKSSQYRMSTDSKQTNRYLGVVLGAAVGDALGAGYEFTNPHEDELIEMIGGGTFDWAPGEWTDDTQMSLAVLSALANGSISTLSVAENFLEWYDSDPPDVGTQTRSVLGAAETPDALEATAAAFLDAKPEAAGNGGLMRTSPAALISQNNRDEISDYARKVSALTHPHKDSVNACILWSLAIQQAANWDEHEKPFDWVEALKDGLDYIPKAEQSRWEMLIGEAVEKEPSTFNPNGWVVAAFQAALSVIVNTKVSPEDPSSHFRETLVNAVKIGDDTDTVSSIAGAYLGARWGKSAIPAKWLQVLNGYKVNQSDSLDSENIERLVLQVLNLHTYSRN